MNDLVVLKQGGVVLASGVRAAAKRLAIPVLVAGGVWALLACSVTTYEVPSRAMEPAHAKGEKLFVNRLAYLFSAGPQKGDVVLVEAPEGGRVLKRVAGLPGEVVEGTTVPADHLFVVGDLPDRSRDSRHWGPIGRDAVIGRASLVYAKAPAIH